jgi:hypothetical protein
MVVQDLDDNQRGLLGLTRTLDVPDDARSTTRSARFIDSERIARFAAIMVAF